MSFGPTQAQQNTNNQQTAITQKAVDNSTLANSNGAGLLKIGGDNTAQGTNFFSRILNGNSADTAATLQPSIDQIRSGTNQNLQQLSTLMPRGGGRSASLFSAAMAPQQQIQNLFNTTRTAAATTLPQIGLQQGGLGTNLFGIGNQALSTGAGSNAELSQALAQQKQQQLALTSALGGGLFKLATTPFGGGSAGNGLLGLFGGG